MEVGYVFSGGGVRCVAHLAVYQALMEQGIEASCFSGTSAGAIAAVLIAAGKEPKEIMQVVEGASVLAAMRPAFNRKGLLDVEKTLAFFMTDVPESFAALHKPVSIGTINVRTGKSVFFSEGALHPPLLASCCVPIIFNPVKIGEEYYLDGGLINNMPVEPLQDKCYKIMGVHCNPVDEDYPFTSMRGMLERTFLLTVGVNVQQRKALCDVFLEPPFLKSYKVFDFKNSKAIFRETYAWSKERVPEIKRLLTGEE